MVRGSCRYRQIEFSRPRGDRRDRRKLRLCGKVRFRDHV